MVIVRPPKFSYKEYIELKNIDKFKEIFDKSPIGIIFYDNEGKLVDANNSALNIWGISKLEDIIGSYIFDNQNIADKKEELLNDGLIKFHAPLVKETINNKEHNISKKSKMNLINWIVSDTDSGFLVQIQPITYQHENETYLQDSEEKYRRFFEDDLTGDFIATTDGILMDCNPSFIEIYGFENREKVLNYDISQFNPSDWDNLILKLKKDCKIKGHQSWHKKPDGKLIHVIANVVGIFNDSKQLLHVKGYVFDDTERKRTEEHLKESEKKYRSLFDDDLTGDFIATPKGKIIECNPSFADIYGFESCENALNYDISKFNPHDWIKMITQLKTDCKIKGYQSWHKRVDGNSIHVVSNVVGIFNELKQLIQVKGYVFDDTERKNAEEYVNKSEEKYRRLFDEDLTGDFIATLDGKILECNPSFADIYAFDSCEMASHCNISKFNRFDWPYMVTRLQKERKLQGFQSWQRRSDGMRIHVVANLVGIFNDLDELIQVKGYVFDDTERKLAEEELARSKSQMKEILDSIHDGFIVLSHYWHFVYVNQCAAEYFGVDYDNLIGQNLWERFPELIGTIYEDSFRKAMETEEIQYFKAQNIFNPDQFSDFSVYPSSEGLSIYWRVIEQK